MAQSAEGGQKVGVRNSVFAPSCISRGLFALKMRPKFGVPKIRFGRSKFALLRMLNTSQRSSSCRLPADGPRLRHRQIHVRESRADDAIPRRIPKGERRLQRERRRVEPAFCRALARRQIGIAQLIGPLGRTRADIRLVDAEIDGERRA